MRPSILGHVIVSVGISTVPQIQYELNNFLMVEQTNYKGFYIPYEKIIQHRGSNRVYR